MIDLSRRGAVAVLTLNRAPVNALDDGMIDAMHAVLDELSPDETWSVLHIRSAQRVFAAGADLAQIQSFSDSAAPASRLIEYVERLQLLYTRIESLKAVTLCEISGAALGGGLELTLACDLRVAAREAKLGLPEVGIGLLPGAGGTQRLTRLCGRGAAGRLILGSEAVDGQSALNLGIVQWAVPRAELPDFAAALAARIAGYSPAALAHAKTCIQAYGDPARDGARLERELSGALLETPLTQQLIAGFLNKRSA